MANNEPLYKKFKPAWRSFYKSFLLMILLIVLAFLAPSFIGYFKENPAMSKWLWIIVVVVDVLIFLMVAVKRSTATLELHDNPAKTEEQEVGYTECNPLKPFSSDFRHSIEIGFRSIIDIKIGQTMIQTLLGIGDIVITSSGTGKEEIIAKNILHPQEVREEIQKHAGRYTAQ